MNKAQNGSGHLVLLIVIVVALLGVLGFLYWKNFMQNDSSKNSTSSTSTTEPQKESPAQENKNELTLEDWGVKFTIADSLQSTQVKYNKKSSIDPSITYYVFTTARIEALGGECTKEPFGDIVSLRRESEKPVAVPDGKLLNQEKINGYYYTMSEPVASCSNMGANRVPSGAVSATETNDKNALKTTLETISAR